MPVAGGAIATRLGPPRAALGEWRNELAALLALVGVAIAIAVFSSDVVPAGVYGRGVVAASFLAIHAIGVVLVYRTDRFVNFAQFQIGALGGTLFAVFVQAEPLFRLVRSVCPPCLDEPSPLLIHLNYGLGLTLGLGLAVLIATTVHLGVVRTLSNASRLALTVASIFLIQALAGLRDPLVALLTTERQRSEGIPSGAVGTPVDWSFSYGGARFQLVDVLVVVTAVVAMAGFAVYLRRTDTGRAIRAAADDRDRASTLGINVAAVTGKIWIGVGLLSGAAAVLTVMGAGEGSVSAGLNVSVLVRLLAIVVVARLVSMVMAVFGALALGMLDEVVLWVAGSSLPMDGALLVIIAGLLLLQRRERQRPDEAGAGSWRATRELRPIPDVLRRLPEVRRYRQVGVTLVVVGAAAAPWLLSPHQTNLITVALIYAIVGVSLLVLTGWAGLVSLGQFAFAAIGAYVVAATALPAPIAVVAGVLAGALTAVLVGVPALKLRGLWLAVMTLAFALATTAMLLHPRYLGARLGDGLELPVLLGVDLAGQRPAYYLALVVLTLTCVAVVGLRRSRTGRVLIAARDNEAAIRSVGVDLARARLFAFGVSGAIAALAGILFAYQQGGVRPDAFSPELSVTIFVFTVIGGLGSVLGPVLGFLTFGLISIGSTTPTVIQLASGFGGLALLLAAPAGLAGVAYRLRDTVLRRIADRHRIVVPSLFADLADADADHRAPIRPKIGDGGGTAFVAPRYTLVDQWTATIDGDGDAPEVVAALAGAAPVTEDDDG